MWGLRRAYLRPRVLPGGEYDLPRETFLLLRVRFAVGRAELRDRGVATDLFGLLRIAEGFEVRRVRESYTTRSEGCATAGVAFPRVRRLFLLPEMPEAALGGQVAAEEREVVLLGDLF